MAIQLDRVERRVRDRICPNCARFTRMRTCSLPPNRECAIFSNLPEIAAIVESTNALSIGPYLDEVRSRICRTCLEDAHGCCPLRNAVDCALDCYLPMVVEEIEIEMESQQIPPGNAARSIRMPPLGP